MKEQEMKLIAELIHRVLSNHEDESVIKSVRDEVYALCSNFPLYQSLLD